MSAGSFSKALALKPDFVEAHNNLANALLRRGRAQEALAHYQRSLEIQPDNVRTLSNLALGAGDLAGMPVRNGAQAIELAQRANQLSGGQDPVILRTLAAAYAEGGRSAESVTTAEHALQLAAAQSNATLAEALRSQIKFYQAGAPFRDPGPTNGAANPGPP